MNSEWDEIHDNLRKSTRNLKIATFNVCLAIVLVLIAIAIQISQILK